MLLTGDKHSNAVRRWLKRWLSEALSAQYSDDTDRIWWAEGGSVKWIWKQDHFERVYEYVERQKTIQHERE